MNTFTDIVHHRATSQSARDHIQRRVDMRVMDIRQHAERMAQLTADYFAALEELGEPDKLLIQGSDWAEVLSYRASLMPDLSPKKMAEVYDDVVSEERVLEREHA